VLCPRDVWCRRRVPQNAPAALKACAIRAEEPLVEWLDVQGTDLKTLRG
jgi:hypothetical protein